MFESSPSFEQLDLNSEIPLQEPLSIKSILLQSDLPDAVKTAHLSHICERRIDPTEISRLTEPTLLQKEDAVFLERLRIRRKALGAHLGSTLTCVLIRLPGVAYTIEIDSVSGSIAHWEWQRI